MAENGFETVVLVDNEDLLVMQETLAEGGFEAAHTHDLPYLLIAVSGDRGEVCDADGNQVAEIDYKAFAPGFMAYVGPDVLPTTHALKNTGTEPIVVIRVELRNAVGASGSTRLALGIDAEQD